MITRVLTVGAFTALPLVGVLWLGWDWREIVLLYWLENVSIGAAMFVTLLRTARATPMTAPQETTQHPAAGIIIAFFFAIHYGMFTLVHGVFVSVLINGGLGPATATDRPLDLTAVLLVWAVGGAVQVVAAFIGPLPSTRGTALMMSAYPRIIVLHLAIILGVFAIIALQWGAAAAIVLIAIHALMTVLSWMRADRRNATAATASAHPDAAQAAPTAPPSRPRAQP